MNSELVESSKQKVVSIDFIAFDIAVYHLQPPEELILVNSAGCAIL